MTNGGGIDAAEAAVLLSLPRPDARKAIKIGLFSLLLQQVLRLEVEERHGLLRTRQVVRLRIGPAAPRPLSDAAQSLLAVVRAVRDGTLPQIVNQARRQYGRTLAGFVHNCVAPALIRRGLAQERRTRLLGLLSYRRIDLTPAGEAERRRLEGAMHEARSIPALLDRDPAAAVALAAATGTAILLVDELKPHYRRLSEAMRAPNGGDPAGSIDVTSRPTGGGERADDDLTGLDFDFAAIDFGVFDSFDTGFAAFDAGFDAASDGGGDSGGGGDGGSSSC